MNVLNIEHIYKTYGDKHIFEDASFGIQEQDKIGIVGINGTGKSTLLRMAVGEETADEGQIVRKNGLKIAYLPQTPSFGACSTIRSYIQDGEVSEWEVESQLRQLGMEDMDASLDQLSGGQRRKVALAKVLSAESDMLILDEPTNHLDQAMIDWLESVLRAYRGTILMVTHDRYFLDKVTNRILEISHGKVYSYEANYSGFLELKAEREEMELASERKRQSLLRMEMEWAKRGCRARSTKQKARLERLEALKKGKAPAPDQTVILDSVHTRMGRKTIELQHVSKSYNGRRIIDDFNYIFLKDQKVGIIGPNGCGKSTLLKIAGGLLPPDSGKRIRGGIRHTPDLFLRSSVVGHAEHSGKLQGALSIMTIAGSVIYFHLSAIRFQPEIQGIFKHLIAKPSGQLYDHHSRLLLSVFIRCHLQLPAPRALPSAGASSFPSPCFHGKEQFLIEPHRHAVQYG